MTFYQHCLGGELYLQTVGESPVASHLPAAAQASIMHARLTTDALTVLASDALQATEPFAIGNAMGLCLDCSSDEEINTLFARLAVGGTVTQPLADMFWGGKYGALTDQFGMNWLFNYDDLP